MGAAWTSYPRRSSLRRRWGRSRATSCSCPRARWPRLPAIARTRTPRTPLCSIKRAVLAQLALARRAASRPHRCRVRVQAALAQLWYCPIVPPAWRARTRRQRISPRMRAVCSVRAAPRAWPAARRSSPANPLGASLISMRFDELAATPINPYTAARLLGFSHVWAATHLDCRLRALSSCWGVSPLPGPIAGLNLPISVNM